MNKSRQPISRFKHSKILQRGSYPMHHKIRIIKAADARRIIEQLTTTMQGNVYGIKI